MELFEWDDANLLHIAQHDVSVDEVEHALTHDPLDIDVEVREGEERLAQIGSTGHGRILLIVSVAREGRIRVVTAFTASRRYRLLFESWRGQNYGTAT